MAEAICARCRLVGTGLICAARGRLAGVRGMCCIPAKSSGEEFVKLVLFQSAANSEILPGLITDRGVVDISAAVKKGYTPQLTMQGIIDDYDRLKPSLEKLAAEGKAVPEGQVQLKPPLPRPGKILCCIANYWEHAQREARPLNMFMKNPDAVVGPGDTIMIDVSARELGRRTWPAIPLTSWLGKSFDTFAPIGPCIATADEIKDPNDLIVRFWDDGVLRHNYNTDDMEHRVPELVEWATTVMTMNSGDLIACGTNHEGLGFLQDGETVDIEIQHIGKMTLEVRDPLKRTWEKGVYMGVDSTNPDAVKRHRPQGGATATGAV
jgi:2-keto-4-pentenoate hydratase/2-oxohepta-3-ene-1,7-dioic acid hydratase in catechol pathway